MGTRFSRRLAVVERGREEFADIVVVLVSREPETGAILGLTASVGSKLLVELTGDEASQWLEDNPATITIGNW